MNIKLNNQESKAYIHNLAFIKAFLIKSSIENLCISTKEKNDIFHSILKYLKDNELEGGNLCKKEQK